MATHSNTQRKAVEAPNCLDNNASDDEDLEAYIANIKREALDKERKLSSIPAALPDDEKVQDYGPEAVRVYIGNPHTVFIFQRSDLNQSPVLSRLVNFDSATGFYAMSPLLSKIDPADFKEVAQYLEHRDYFPEIYDADTEFASLEGLVSHETEIAAIDRCVIVTIIAQKLEMPELQALAVSKFKVLQPIHGDHFLNFIQLLFGSLVEWEGPMYDFVIEYLSSHFRELQRAHRGLVDELLNEHPGLATKLRISVSPDVQIIPNPTAPPTAQYITSEHALNRIDTAERGELQGASPKHDCETTSNYETT